MDYLALPTLTGSLFVIFLAVAAVCDDALGPALESVSKHLRLSHQVASATILALGLALPEIALNALAAVSGSDVQVDSAVGAVLGSGLLAFTVIPAACVAFAKGGKFELDQAELLRDVGFFCAVLLLLSIFARNGTITLKEALLLVLVYFPYLCCLLCFQAPPPEPPSHAGHPTHRAAYGAVSPDVEAEPMVPRPQSLSSSDSASDDSVGEPDWVPWWFKQMLPPYGLDPHERFVTVLAMSVCFILLCAEVCLQISVSLSVQLGVSNHWTGFVLMGLGAQMEDLFAAIYLAKMGRGTSAMAATVGSQVLNICGGVGMPFMVKAAVTGASVVVHSSTKSSLVVFACVVAFTVLCLKECRLRKASLTRCDVPLLLAAYGLGVYCVFNKPAAGHV